MQKPKALKPPKNTFAETVNASLEEKGAVAIKWLRPYNLHAYVITFEYFGQAYCFIIPYAEIKASQEHIKEMTLQRFEKARSYNDIS